MTAASENKKVSKTKGLPKGRQVVPNAAKDVSTILGERPRTRDLLIEYLHLIQDKYGYLSANHLAALAQEMRLSQAEVFEVASFYHRFEIIKEDDAEPAAYSVRVCDSIACEVAGADRLISEIEKNFGDAIRVIRAPCMGACDQAPVASVRKRQLGHCTVKDIGRAMENEMFSVEIPDYQSIEAYIAEDGYESLKNLKAGTLSKDDVLAQLELSELRGMGGAGFPVARKWRFLEGSAKPRLLVVNADEGEPGTFKDRHCLATEPHRMLEGALIAAAVIEADDIYIYLRDEYPEIAEILSREIAALEESDILSPAIHLRRGAGAYICGEETALLESLEGKRGLPRNRPPYPAINGLFGRPTLINNVETLFWVAEIMKRGGDWYKNQGRPRYYSVSGRVKNPGVVLAPAGTTARQLIDEHCGGMAEGEIFAAYLPGGASGGILPADMADLPLEFGELDEYGCFVGSGAVVVFSENDDVRAVAKNLVRFFEDESCGQCTPCRIGCEKMLSLMAEDKWDYALMIELAETMRDASICGLGQAAPNPVTSAIQFFEDASK
ncbi:MAG: NAD(P)H-dependent oxidoreductase subunit E [Rhodospirillales bacterium]|nr:NAD(P)H-dependent oxidoreductase subunit E [Rhodospirillales bacterium]